MRFYYRPTFAIHRWRTMNSRKPVVTTALARWLKSLARRRFTYRIVFAPETIGAITYLSRNLDRMKANTAAGFVVTCVGDNRSYSFLRSRLGNTLADRVGSHVMKWHDPDHIEYSYLERGSDERQYGSPGVDLPVVSIMRTRYGKYPEYHTSKDNLDLISPMGLQGAFQALRECIVTLENNYFYQVECKGEPQLGKRGLYPTLNTKKSGDAVKDLMNVLAYADGDHDAVAIADIVGLRFGQCIRILKKLEAAGVVSHQGCVNHDRPARALRSRARKRTPHDSGDS